MYCYAIDVQTLYENVQMFLKGEMLKIDPNGERYTLRLFFKDKKDLELKKDIDNKKIVYIKHSQLNEIQSMRDGLIWRSPNPKKNFENKVYIAEVVRHVNQ